MRRAGRRRALRERGVHPGSASVQPVNDRSEAQAIVSALRAEHPGAAHVCWALLAGGQSAAVDDGEPSGTAGRPMLDVLRHQGLEGVLATVVRYYGGVKLGAGGLVRAYTDCVAQALKSAEKIPRIAQTVLACTVPYAQEGLLRREIERVGAQLLRVQHGSAVCFEVRLPAAQAVDWQTEIGELTQGRAVWS